VMKMRRQQFGFSLIEVLVSVVIMSVGILGVAGMQVLSLQQNRSSLLRAEALQLGNDILDRMRANPQQDYAGIDFTDDPPGSSNCFNNTCSAVQMKDYDTAQWKCSINSEDADDDTYTICTTYNIAGSLPGGAGAIVDDTDDTLCAVGADEICVVVRWLDDRDGGTASISLRTRVN
jgi:type IV pilus modification protein PilV